MPHLLSQDFIKEKCYHCYSNLSEFPWKSEFHGEAHYKTTTCNCGKTNCIKVDYIGSGHDSWNKEEKPQEITGITTLENRIKILKVIDKGHA